MTTGFLEFYTGKTVFITGNTGFKGAWLCYWLNMLGAKVVGYSKDIPTDPSFYKTMDVESSLLKQYWEDIRDRQTLQNAIESSSVDLVFHLAAQPIVRASIVDPIDTFETNTIGTANVLDTLRRQAKQIPVVIITSDKCYENNEWLWGYRESDPLGGSDPYSASKAAAELVFSSMTRTYPHLIAATGRAGNVIGGGDWADNRIVPDAIRYWGQQDFVEVRAPLATRPWQHVLEPLSGYLQLGIELFQRNACVIGQSFNFGPSETTSYSVKFLLDEMLLRWPSQKCGYLVSEGAGVEAGLLKLNCDKAAAVLDWQQRLSIFETLDYTIDWYWQNMQGGNLKVLCEKQINTFMKGK
ncbi:CDP-glucose 4,6-dehydratase [Paraglaciecola polaris]|uniref:CDP-glucose 4,6-dehydratase n=1 Tax=Paraglaciecola polaris TaxID=222814 RepID=UPI0030EE22BD|tara:strand:+ start:8022 stop:9083 length:1062 start_codon:yes stop_codon:yes gene_type:complete